MGGIGGIGAWGILGLVETAALLALFESVTQLVICDCANVAYSVYCKVRRGPIYSYSNELDIVGFEEREMK